MTIRCCRRRSAISRASSSMTPRISASSPASRRSGIPPSISSPSRESGLDPISEPLQRAANWMDAKEVRIRADWAKKNPHPIASGWAFEFNNVYYPDTDDTAMVLIGLRMVGLPHQRNPPPITSRCSSGRSSGSFASSAATAAGRRSTATSPSAGSRMSPLPITTPSWTPRAAISPGRTLELLGYIGYDLHCRRVQRAIQFLEAIRRRRMAHGMAAGASITSTAPGRCCAACAPSAWT